MDLHLQLYMNIIVIISSCEVAMLPAEVGGDEEDLAAKLDIVSAAGAQLHLLTHPTPLTTSHL